MKPPSLVGPIPRDGGTDARNDPYPEAGQSLPSDLRAKAGWLGDWKVRCLWSASYGCIVAFTHDPSGQRALESLNTFSNAG